MVLAAPDRGEVTSELLSILLTDTGRPIGDGEAPGDPKIEPECPYAILYPLTHGPTFGDVRTVVMPDRQQLLIYQVTAIGDTREQADWLAHKCRRAITDTTTNPNGWRLEIGTTNTVVIDRRNNVSLGTGKEGGKWRASDRYQLMVTVRGPDAVF